MAVELSGLEASMMMNPVAQALIGVKRGCGISEEEFNRRWKAATEKARNLLDPDLESIPPQEFRNTPNRTRLIAYVATGRHFALSKMGFMTLVPKGAEKGDVLVIFRPRGNGSSVFSLVGEGYVHGMTDGEAAGDVLGSQKPLWFIIK